MIGLGTMGSNLALNIAASGFPLVVQNRTHARTEEFLADAGPLEDKLAGAETPNQLVAALQPPRAIILMVPAGAPVDQQIAALAPLLSPGDMIIDAGNADFNDTRRRATELAEAGLVHVGMGVSGGAEGARHGPSIMVGTTPEAWQAIRPMVNAIAARFRGDPCADRLGGDGAGHFVKTVHNGIEYADMQLIAEVWGLLRDGNGAAPAEAGRLFGEWNKGPLSSYLVEITATVLGTEDPASGRPMVELILDRAGQKGTGRWTLIEALKLGQSATTIEAAVAARAVSAQRELRLEASTRFDAPGDGATPFDEDDLEAALLAAKIMAYAQGFILLAEARRAFDWDMKLSRVAEIWRAGCIIRSALLDGMAEALSGKGPAHDNLLLAPSFAKMVGRTVPALRRVVCQAATQGLPVPALSAALGYFDGIRQARGTADLIQAQRDFFGEHGFERIDRDGQHHGPW
ncbi:6-phosphogluconate dehydrogenase [Loktanella sp. 22II-4b]|nr:6-phosphogluconate dehydrogenase [Loktanella sp. 22II-4b]